MKKAELSNRNSGGMRREIAEEFEKLIRPIRNASAPGTLAALCLADPRARLRVFGCMSPVVICRQ